MKLSLVLVLLASMVIIPQYVLAADTIDELVAPYDVEACIECHEDIHDEWKDSWHGKAVIDSRVLRTWRTLIKRGFDGNEQAPRKTLKDMCLPCHAPAIKDASDKLATEIAGLVVTAVDDPDKSKRDAATHELSKLNINCLVCHNLKATPDNNPEPNTIYGPNEIVDDPHPHEEEMGRKTVKTDYLKKAEFCKQCHHGCPPGMPSSVCPTLWTSYEEKFLAHGGKETCQECHMPKTEDEYTSHKFPGIYEVDQVKKSVELKLTTRTTEYVYHLQNKVVPAVVVKVDITNKAGHGIPHG